jgi:cell wall-associated NlpC family hydrolase
MPAATGHRRYYLCALVGAFALAAAPVADAQLAARRAHASTAAAQPPQGRLKAAPPAGAAPAGVAWAGAQDVAIFALGMIGVDYRFGGTAPESGLDCSGLVQHVFLQVTGAMLPRTSKEMSGLGSKVRIDELAPGDLVFFNTRRFSFSHVGIYLGNDRFVHAPSRGGEVQIATLSEAYWHKRFDGARRLVGAPPSVAPTFADSIADIAPAGLASARDAESTP